MSPLKAWTARASKGRAAQAGMCVVGSVDIEKVHCINKFKGLRIFRWQMFVDVYIVIMKLFI